MFLFFYEDFLYLINTKNTILEKENKWNKTNQWENEIEQLHAIIRKTPLVETTKWGGPVYTYNNKNVLGIGGFKSYFGIWFYNGVFLKDEKKLLINANEESTKSLRQMRFNSVNEIDEKLILAYIKEAIEIEERYNQTIEEVLEASYQSLRQELAQELLQRVKSFPPRFFEQLVIDLLVAMGYGGSQKDAGKAIGQSHDGGIDGIINEDKLGLDVVYIQAKRWENTVGRPVVQAFAGSLEGQRARKGILITTSQFSIEAREYVRVIEKKIVLIDGEQLTQLMIDYGVGVAEKATYTVKKIDEDYFSGE